MLALQAWGGAGAVELLVWDIEAGAMLIERALPGEELTRIAEQGSDEEATAIACDVMRHLPKPNPGEQTFPRRNTAATYIGDPADRAADLPRLRERYDGGTGPFPEPIVDRAEAAFREMISSQGPQVLIHGDLHHENLLSAEREPWLVIDPHGMIAEAEYETYALLKNPTGVAHWPDVEKVTRRRIDQIADLLGYDRRRIVGWGIAGAVLSAWWTLEGHGFDYEDDLVMAEIIARQ